MARNYVKAVRGPKVLGVFFFDDSSPTDTRQACDQALSVQRWTRVVYLRRPPLLASRWAPDFLQVGESWPETNAQAIGGHCGVRPDRNADWRHHLAVPGSCSSPASTGERQCEEP